METPPITNTYITQKVQTSIAFIPEWRAHATANTVPANGTNTTAKANLCCKRVAAVAPAPLPRQLSASEVEFTSCISFHPSLCRYVDLIESHAAAVGRLTWEAKPTASSPKMNHQDGSTCHHRSVFVADLGNA